MGKKTLEQKTLECIKNFGDIGFLVGAIYTVYKIFNSSDDTTPAINSPVYGAGVGYIAARFAEMTGAFRTKE